MRILIANRGEIARRILRTAHRMGYETVAAWADPDREAPFVAEATSAIRLGPAALADSYLSIDAVLDAASKSGATAVHPGYGFLSENAAFARAVEAAGLTWIGPHPGAIEKMGSKIEARRLAAAAGVPIIPGFDGSQDEGELAQAADRIGYPVLVKAAAGGGGKGIRVVFRPQDFSTALGRARSEARRAFGDDAMIVERYVQRPRHVEVQVLGDRHGRIVDLGTRECSVQRRYQKVLEEAPAPNLSPSTRSGLCETACKLAAAIAYDSLGTVEYVVDAESGEYFFLEMNTRLQVEHPTTEAVTGLDLVELQIRVAAGEEMPVDRASLVFDGHAFEARINAEDPERSFAPQAGQVLALQVPEGVRWDAGIEAGSVVQPYYDSLLAKLVVSGPDRSSALRRLTGALDDLLLAGPPTTAAFHRWLVEQDEVREGRVTTRFLDEAAIQIEADPAAAAEIAARAWMRARAAEGDAGPWAELRDFRTTPHRPASFVLLRDAKGETFEVPAPVAAADSRGASGAEREWPVEVDLAARRVAVSVRGRTWLFSVPTRSEHWAPEASRGHGAASAIVAPFPAVVTEIAVSVGDEVSAGDAVVVIEAMKMLHALTAPGPGRVEEICVAPGSSVATGDILVRFEQE
jgi:3-methylcrotonyl-CoA carboxylase alpha subunit